MKWTLGITDRVVVMAGNIKFVAIGAEYMPIVKAMESSN
jgi:hypothetical protein